MPEQHVPLLRYILRAERRRCVRKLIQKTLQATQELDEESEASAEEAKGTLAESETDSETEEETEEKQLSHVEMMWCAEQPARSRKASAREADPVADSALGVDSGVKAVGLKSLLDAFEADSDDDRRSRSQRKRQASSLPAGGLCVFEGAEGADASSAVLDFCSVNAAQQILVGMHPRKDRKTEQAERGAKRESKFSRVKVNEEGKIVIEEEEEGVEDEKGKSSNSSSGGKKNLSCLAARRAALREMRKRQSRGHILQRSGADFKAKKAKGDLKTKGGVEPYAFVKLNRGVLKEKYRAQAVRVRRTKNRKANSQTDRPLTHTKQTHKLPEGHTTRKHRRADDHSEAKRKVVQFAVLVWSCLQVVADRHRQAEEEVQ
ncbi:hypothetical protein Emag_001478 [Eimeria magna]